jgi:HSP20 family protein
MTTPARRGASRWLDFWGPRGDLFDWVRDLQRRIDEAFGELATPSRSEAPALAVPPRVDVFEEGNELVVKAEMPGVPKENIDVSVKDGVLSLHAESTREEEKEERGYYRKERHYGAFTRQLALPVEVDESSAKATYKDGVLEVRLAKASPEQTGARKIEVQ